MTIMVGVVDINNLENGLHPELLHYNWQPYSRHLGLSGPAITLGLPNGTQEMLVEDFAFEWEGKTYVIPRGFVTDYASIPRFFHRILPQRGRYNWAGLAHDYLYWSGAVPKDSADRMLHDLAMESGVGTVDADMLWAGVKVGGWVAWNHYREMESKAKRPCPHEK